MLKSLILVFQFKIDRNIWFISISEIPDTFKILVTIILSYQYHYVTIVKHRIGLRNTYLREFTSTLNEVRNITFQRELN